jgi:hypothetical protein
MTKPLNPMFKPENRAKLIVDGMKKIEILQSKTITQASTIIGDIKAFESEMHIKFVSYINK